MVQTAYVQQWDTPTFDRECGSCYACCVYLGIEELKKYTGQACKHLDGIDANKRCSIYEHRPHACSGYQCVWRAGLGPPELRPHDSGLLITMYQSETDPGHAAATVIIIDETKAKQSQIDSVATELLMLPTCNEVRLVNYKTKSALLFKDGTVYQCKLLPPDGYEALVFRADAPVGHYRIAQPPTKE